GEVTNWGAEMGPPHALQRSGWRRDTLKIGEEVTVDGYLARNGSKRINARQVTLTATGTRPGQTLDANSSRPAERYQSALHAAPARVAGAAGFIEPVIDGSTGRRIRSWSGMRRVLLAISIAVVGFAVTDSVLAQRRPLGGPPPGPAPRNEDGRVLLGGATP